MKREFFASSVEQAVNKASELLGIPESEIKYTEVAEQFGEVFAERKVAIVVEYEEREQPPPAEETTVGPSEEEKAARAEGNTRWATFLIDGILKRMNIESKTESYQKGEHVILSVQVDEGQLDLRRGESRELRGAIQHVVNRSLTMAGDEGRRFIVDIGGSLEERSEKIGQLAADLTRKVQSLDKTVHIHLMDSQDRRLLHTSVMEGKTLSSQGRGEKQFRVLSLEPKKGK